MNHEKQFIIIKKVAKQGSQSVIVIPRVLEKRLKPGTVMKLTMDVLQEANENPEFKFEFKNKVNKRNIKNEI